MPWPLSAPLFSVKKGPLAAGNDMVEQKVTDTDWPADGLEEQGVCPVCGEQRRSEWHAELRDGIFFCAPGTWRMWRCEGCGSGYLDPRPTPDSIGLAYATYYTHAGPDEPHWATGSTRLGRRTGIRNAYLKRRFPDWAGRPLWPGTAGLFLLAPDALALLERDVRHLPPPAPGDRLLDIGCGDGAFLVRAKQLGYRAEGLEFDQAAVDTARARGLEVKTGGFPDPELEDESFGAVTISQVIEHLHDPRAALADALRILRPGGQIWLATPNVDAPGHRHFGANWRGLEPPRHLAVFTTRGLEGALKEAGFEDIRFRAPGPVADFFYRASTRVAQGLAQDAPVTLEADLLAAVRDGDQAARADVRAGEEMVVTAVKPG
jgi:2-polyprenyl-3-methyl-5-hydroxy-6-metoxy-1,4-benzoquinol methylase